MKLYSKISALGAVALMMTAFASADSLQTIQIGSYGTGQFNQGNVNTAMTYGASGSTVNILPGTVWNGELTGVSSWVSYGQTGPTTPEGSQPGGHYVPNGIYTFSTSFDLTGAATAFSLSVLADDTVEVLLDGNTADPLFTYAAGGNSTCQDNQPNCTVVDTITNLTDPSVLALLGSGEHSLTFLVKQTNSIDMGLDFAGSITEDPSAPTPEPNTLLLLGTGLMGSAGALFRRMRSAA